MVRSAISDYQDAGKLPIHFKPRFGEVVAIAELTNSRPLHARDWKAAGYLTPYVQPSTKGWFLENVRQIKPGVVVKGRQGFFFVELDLDGKIGSALDDFYEKDKEED